MRETQTLQELIDFRHRLYDMDTPDALPGMMEFTLPFVTENGFDQIKGGMILPAGLLKETVVAIIDAEIANARDKFPKVAAKED